VEQLIMRRQSKQDSE